MAPKPLSMPAVIVVVSTHNRYIFQVFLAGLVQTIVIVSARNR